jgi:predicted phage tail protein
VAKAPTLGVAAALATTGVPTMYLLLFGLLLAAGGTAMYLGGVAQRRTDRS